MDVHISGSPEDLARQYEESLRLALVNLEKIVEETKAMQEKAIDEIQATHAVRKQIEDSAETIARDVLSRMESALKSQLRSQLEEEVIAKLVKAGRTADEICTWLRVSPEIVQRIIRQEIPFMPWYRNAKLEITDQGRGGTILFQQEETHIEFHWEFGGGKALALIFVPGIAQWENHTGLPLSERLPILNWVAQEVIRRKADGHIYSIQDDVIEIV